MQERTRKLLTMPVIGNAHSDRPVWDAAHAVASDETTPMPDRLQALTKMNELTGASDPCTTDALADYLASCS